MSLRARHFSAMHQTLEKLAVTREAPTSVAEESAQQEQPQPVPEKKPPHPMLTAAKYLGAYGLGTGAGYGSMHGIQHLRGKPFSSTLGHGIPVLTGLAGLAFTYAQNDLFNRMKEDAAKRRGNVG